MCAYLGESEVKRPSKTDSIALVTSVRSQGVHKQSGKILCSFSNQSDELPNPLLQVTRLPSVPVGHKFAWIIHPIENREPVASSRYMYQRPLVKAEILESW
uniref:SOS response associated peptidase (SRAP) n=1 Tax=Mesocestoides corti TaxID=53468 RepID=A0A5K3G1Q4_MESCO